MDTDIGVPGISEAEQIGQGAFGRVYRANQDDFDRVVAVKVLANVDLNEEARVRFAREAKAIGRMSGHPNIVNVYAQGATVDGTPYLIMEYCARGSLGDRIRNGARMSWQEATEIMVAIAGALQTAHNAGILHRDIKPANILLDSYDNPKLADFGIVRMGTDPSVTATGMLTGSPAHIAPELIAGANPSPATDVYSLGSTLFTLITGQAPFHRETDTTILSLLQRISSEPAPHLGQWGVPPLVADLVAATLAKDPAQRPPSCRLFAEALMRARSALGLTPGAYRVDPTAEQPTLDPGATMLPPAGHGPAVPGSLGSPQGPVPLGCSAARPLPPYAPVAATFPSAAFTPAGISAGVPTAGLTAHPVTAGLPDARGGSSGQRAVLIVLCWVVVAMCALIIGWMLMDRAQAGSALGAAYFIGG